MEISTRRLALFPLQASDSLPIHSLWTQPGVRRFIWDDQVIPLSQTRKIIQANLRLFRRCGYGLWAIRRRGDDALIGFAGYWHFRDPPELELIIGFAEEFWGRGLASEAGRALIRCAFQQLDFEEVRAGADAPSRRSIRLAERLGMRFEKRQTVDGLDTVFYRLTRRDRLSNVAVADEEEE